MCFRSWGSDLNKKRGNKRWFIQAITDTPHSQTNYICSVSLMATNGLLNPCWLLRWGLKLFNICSASPVISHGSCVWLSFMGYCLIMIETFLMSLDLWGHHTRVKYYGQAMAVIRNWNCRRFRVEMLFWNNYISWDFYKMPIDFQMILILVSAPIIK